MSTISIVCDCGSVVRIDNADSITDGSIDCPTCGKVILRTSGGFLTITSDGLTLTCDDRDNPLKTAALGSGAYVSPSGYDVAMPLTPELLAAFERLSTICPRGIADVDCTYHKPEPLDRLFEYIEFDRARISFVDPVALKKYLNERYGIVE